MRNGRDDRRRGGIPDPVHDASLWLRSGSGVLVGADLVLTAGHCVNTSHPDDAWVAVRALAYADGRLFGVNGRDELIAGPAFRDERDLGFQPIAGSTANRIVAMCAGSGAVLFCVTEDGWLWWRRAIESGERWLPIARGSDGLVSLATHGTWLYGLRGDSVVMRRSASTVAARWEPFGSVPSGSRAMTIIAGKVFVATSTDRLLAGDVDSIERGEALADVGHANGVAAMAATANRLYAVSDDARVWRRAPVLYEEAWDLVGEGPPLAALAASGELLFGAGPGDGPLYVKPARVRWQPWGSAVGVRSLTAVLSVTPPGVALYGLGPDGQLLRRQSLDEGVGWDNLSLPVPGLHHLAGRFWSLFAVDAEGQLRCSDVRNSPMRWQRTGDEGPGGPITAAGDYLYGADQHDGKLLRRRATTTSAPWEHAGHVYGCLDLASDDRTLWVTVGPGLSTRPASSMEVNWVGLYPTDTHWADPSRWEPVGARLEVRIGVNPMKPALQRTATHFKVCGRADVALVRLDVPVPVDVARPMTLWLEDRAPDAAHQALRASGYGSEASTQSVLTRPASRGASGWEGWLRISTPILAALAISGDDLYAAPEGDGDLRVRPASGSSLQPWDEIEGGTHDFVDMTATASRLWGVSRSGELWTRAAGRAASKWDPVGIDEGDVDAYGRLRALTVHGGFLYAATDDDHLVRRAAGTRLRRWERCGHANDVVTMAAHGADLYCISDATLWWRIADTVERNWEASSGTAPGLRGLVASDDRFLGLTDQDWPLRQIATARALHYPNPDGIRFLADLGGALVFPGDSGSPLWIETTSGGQVCGINQGSNGIGGRYTASFSAGGLGPDGRPLANVREWLRSEVPGAH